MRIEHPSERQQKLNWSKSPTEGLSHNATNCLWQSREALDNSSARNKVKWVSAWVHQANHSGSPESEAGATNFVTSKLSIKVVDYSMLL